MDDGFSSEPPPDRIGCSTSPFAAGCLILVVGLIVAIAGIVEVVNAVRLGKAGVHVMATVQSPTYSYSSRGTYSTNTGQITPRKVAYFQVNGHDYHHGVPGSYQAGDSVELIYDPANPGANSLAAQPASVKNSYRIVAVGVFLLVIGGAITAFVSTRMGPADMSE